MSQGEFQPSWLAAFEAWYPAETDLRGYDQELGWLHAVAHGADLLGAFGRCPQVDPASMLRLAADRLLAPTDYVLRDREDDRLGYAMALTCTRAELTEAESVGWLDPVAADFEAGGPGRFRRTRPTRCAPCACSTCWPTGECSRRPEATRCRSPTRTR